MPGIIKTITRSGVDKVSEDFQFFVSKLRVNEWAMNLFVEGSSPQAVLHDEGLRNQDVNRLYEEMLQLWLQQDDSNLCIREIENVVAGVIGHRAKNCSFNGTCANYFCLDCEGRIWPCDRLSTDAQHLLGDLRHQSLQEILEGDAVAHHAERARHLPDCCISCQWRSACNNGCTAMRNPDTGIYVYCDARRNLFNTMAALLNTAEPITPPAQPVNF